jgi:predicted  nucleic acid-binding Zn-ribbon protein
MPHQCTNCGHVFADGSKEMLSGCPDCGGNKFQYNPGDVAESEPADPPADADADSPEPPEREGGSVAGAVGRAANKVRDAVTSDPDPAARTTGDDADTTDTASTAGAADTSATDSPSATDTSGTADASSSPDVEADPSAPETEASEAVDESDPSSPDAPETGGAPSGDEPAEGIDASTETGDEDAAQADARSSVVDKDSLPDAPSDGRVVKEPDDPEDRPDLDDLRQELNDQFESIRIVAPGQYELNLMELYDRQEYIIALQEDGQYVIEVPDAWETDDE